MNHGAKCSDRAVFTLAAGGFALNALLLGRRLSGGGLVGCAGSCEEVLNSRWSQLLGVPVSVFGLLVYALLLFALSTRQRRLLGPCLGTILAAAGWFIFVQAVMIGRFCPWCMATHGIGVAITVLVFWRQRLAVAPVVASAVLAVSALGLLQFFGPSPVNHRIDDPSALGSPAPGAIHARGMGRKIEFSGGRKIYDLTAMPHLGRVEARWVLVEYFDYSCSACRTMSRYLNALMAKHPDDFCVLLMPVPLEHACNSSLTVGDAEHPGSCELAKLALAVWRTQPAAFAAFHDALLDGASPSLARTMARQLIPDLDVALRDPWSDELLQANIADWVSFSVKTKHLPKLRVTDKRILHGLPSGEAAFIRVIEQELGFRQ